MSGFNYHTGYIPGVAEEEMLKRRFKIRFFLVVLVIALALFWVNKQNGTTAIPAETIPANNPQNTINIDELKKEQPQKKVVQAILPVAPVTEIEKDSVSINTQKSEPVPEFQNTYEKDLDTILNKAFSTN